jgi:hypothetical protein
MARKGRPMAQAVIHDASKAAPNGASNPDTRRIVTAEMISDIRPDRMKLNSSGAS